MNGREHVDCDKRRRRSYKCRQCSALLPLPYLRLPQHGARRVRLPQLNEL